MNSFFRDVLEAYDILEEKFYDELPLVSYVMAYNDVTVPEDSSATRLILPARAGAKNITMAERMRRYVAQRRGR